jgi:hypothetical protein
MLPDSPCACVKRSTAAGALLPAGGSRRRTMSKPESQREPSRSTSSSTPGRAAIGSSVRLGPTAGRISETLSSAFCTSAMAPSAVSVNPNALVVRPVSWKAVAFFGRKTIRSGLAAATHSVPARSTNSLYLPALAFEAHDAADRARPDVAALVSRERAQAADGHAVRLGVVDDPAVRGEKAGVAAVVADPETSVGHGQERGHGGRGQRAALGLKALELDAVETEEATRGCDPEKAVRGLRHSLHGASQAILRGPRGVMQLIEALMRGEREERRRQEQRPHPGRQPSCPQIDGNGQRGQRIVAATLDVPWHVRFENCRVHTCPPARRMRRGTIASRQPFPVTGNNSSPA